MFNKINNINTYRNCLYNLNSFDIISVFPKQKLINNNLQKSIQAPVTTLSQNNINIQTKSQEKETISNSCYTLNNNSKIFNINNIPFEPSVEIFHLGRQLNTMVEKTPVLEETQPINLNEDLKKNVFKDVSLMDNQKDIVDVNSESDSDSDDAKTKINEDISNELDVHSVSESDLSSFDELDILGDGSFNKKDNIGENLYSVKMKLQDLDKTDSDATVVSSPSIIHSEASVVELVNEEQHKFKIL